MDGNITTEDEDEFIVELKGGLPEIKKNFELNFDQIDLIEALTKQIVEKKSQEIMQEA